MKPDMTHVSRCYERRRLGEKGVRLLHPEIFIAGQYCMRALLGRARPRPPSRESGKLFWLMVHAIQIDEPLLR